MLNWLNWSKIKSPSPPIIVIPDASLGLLWDCGTRSPRFKVEATSWGNQEPSNVSMYKDIQTLFQNLRC